MRPFTAGRVLNYRCYGKWTLEIACYAQVETREPAAGSERAQVFTTLSLEEAVGCRGAGSRDGH